MPVYPGPKAVRAIVHDDGSTELAPSSYLRDLAERLRNVPARHIDDYDISRLLEMANDIDNAEVIL